MTQMFEVADPNEARGNSITVREVLDKASKDIESQLSNDQQLQAQMMGVMGDVYHRLGLLTKAETLLNKSIETERRILPPDDSEVASTTNRLASTFADEGKLVDAEKLLR